MNMITITISNEQCECLYSMVNAHLEQSKKILKKNKIPKVRKLAEQVINELTALLDILKIYKEN